ncbi:MAG: DUF4139 domain-containing protein [Candidatus Omnitrophica bacterium]|nr:DUF4139 domain-containing protein [Candidatus Omnitrophota bacterium]
MKWIPLVMCFVLVSGGICEAKVDLVSLPSRDSVQLTIYNSADLTLAKESRSLTLKEGFNDLQFSWANTLIDPTSLELVPLTNADRIDVQALTYPPRVKNLGLWNIDSGLSGQIPVEISYLTSGLSWRAFYLGTLTPDEKEMRLKGYVRVLNNSGEDYENAQVRLIVGKVHIIDQIAQLAQRQYPYERPGIYPAAQPEVHSKRSRQDVRVMKSVMMGEGIAFGSVAPMETKEIIKEGLSEYFLYTIEGRETILNGWSKRLPSFDVASVPVVNLYKYEEERYGYQVIRFLSFKNDEDHLLGETPIPGGLLKVFRNVDAENHLSYEGQSEFKYIPIDEDVELNLGAVQNIVVEPKLMNLKTENFMFDRHGNINGWDEVRTYKMEVKNTRQVPVEVEIKRNFNALKWDIHNEGAEVKYEKIDANTVKYKLALQSKENKTFQYTLRTFHGRRGDHK